MPETLTSQGSTTPQTQEAPPPVDGWRPDLGALRARLDEIDNQIHDLLIDRAKVVEGVARSGKPAAFRPGREASILRRLLGRHSGKLPASTLVRMWREMLAGTTAMQSPVTVAVFDPSGGVGAIAREHFGFLTPAIPHDSPKAALDAVRAGAVTVAVLPYAKGDAAWWPLLNSGGTRLYVIARLPFWAPRPAHIPAADALVVATTPPDASEHDRSILALDDGAIVEVDGMLSDGDPAVPPKAQVLGGYAIPVAGESV